MSEKKRGRPAIIVPQNIIEEVIYLHNSRRSLRFIVNEIRDIYNYNLTVHKVRSLIKK